MRASGTFAKIMTLIVACLMTAGVIGFTLIEGWGLGDSIFMTLITVSTVGYGEVNALTPNGRVFTNCFILVSMVLMTCWTSAMTSFLVSGELSGNFKRLKEKKMIGTMKDHAVIAGGGVMARTIIDRLLQAGVRAVVVTQDSHEIKALRRKHPELMIVEDDPKSELALADANALEAKYLVAATDNDFDNLLIIITGKGLGQNLQVIGCAQSTELTSRMIKVGADEIICPSLITGEFVASLITGKEQGASPGSRKFEMAF